MIEYESGGPMGGLQNLIRIHGSAAYKCVVPAVLSTLVLLGYEIVLYDPQEQRIDAVDHPNAIGAFVAFFSFLLTFRLNYAYSRYWEACSSVYQMQSKWLDLAICMAAFHYQSKQYNDIQPPTFGTLPKSITADQIQGRERNFQGLSRKATEQRILKRDSITWKNLNETDANKANNNNINNPSTVLKKAKHRRTTSQDIRDQQATKQALEIGRTINARNAQSNRTNNPYASFSHSTNTTIPIPTRFQDQFLRQLSPSESLQILDDESSTSERSQEIRNLWRGNKQSRAYRHLTKSWRSKMPTPSLFLQETAHLVSLLSAVAMSTLRNDIDQASSPIAPYVPGTPWPPVDPDYLPRDVMAEYGEANLFWRWVYFCLGLSRSAKRRTMYNAARPFLVLGGVSDREVELLQKARGPEAKVALCTLWIQEFLTRESLGGSTGSVAAPILSRLYQMLSDGMQGYGQSKYVWDFALLPI
jgi:hypothetical protein